MSAPTRAQVLEAGLVDVNGVRSDIGLPPLDQLIPEPLDRMSDEPIERCVVTASILHDAGPGWAGTWEGWDKLRITGPGVDLLLVVPACTELTLWWSRDDLPGLAPQPGPFPPFLARATTPTRDWDDTDLEAAIEDLGWYADGSHLGHPDADVRDSWRKHLIASLRSSGGACRHSMAVTSRGVLVGRPDQSIARIPYEALIAACRQQAEPAIGEQLVLGMAA